MDAADIAWLRTAEGTTATTAATSLLTSSAELGALRQLGRTYTSEQARAAVALVRGRESAGPKFADATALFCDRDAAEQASHEAVARHLASRFAGFEAVADLGCGMGGDTLAVAEHASVVAIDRDPARLAMTAANADIRGHAARIEVVRADLATWAPPPGIDAIWADPARRDTSGRRLDPEAWSPPLSRVLELASMVGAAGIKLAPGIDLADLPADGEVEFVSLERGLRAAVLWTGRLARGERTATVLPTGLSLVGAADETPPAIEAPGAYLYDPDPSVGRAGLVAVLARQIEAWQLDERIAYLSSDTAVTTPFARRLRVHSWLPFAERALLANLREASFGRVEVARRGSPVDTNDLERRLNGKLSGARPVGVVVLTRYREQHISLVCERETEDDAGKA